MVAMPNLTPSTDTIVAFLAEITSGWDDLPEPAALELRCLFPDRTPDIRRFEPTPEGFSELAAHAVVMNGHGLNAYVVINPVRVSAPIRRNGKMSGAADEDIIAAFYFWADGDDEEAANSIRNFAGPKWTMAVTTGRVPSTRPHIYWRCDEPILNLDAWTGVQKAIAARLSTDRTVVNPSRIMRLPGTVNWPTDKKAAKGRIPELATLRTEYEDDRDPVSFEQMLRAFGSVSASAPETGQGGIDTGHQSKSASDYADILRRARTDGEKHGGVRDLSASLAGAGVPRHMAEAIVREACPVWDAGVEKLIETAYAKFFSPQDEQFREITDAEREAIPPAMFRPWVVKDLSRIPHPEFVYSDFYARGYTSVTVAPPKVGKSMLGLAEAIDMATGRGFLTGAPREPLKVVYYNAEDDENVIDGRIAALLGAYDIDQNEIAGQIFPTSGVDRPDFFMVSGQEGVINEALFISIEKFIKETGADALIFDPLQDLSRSPETNEVFRLLGQRLRRMASTMNVALGLIHHTRKLAPGVAASIDDARGGSALRGTARFNRLLIGMTEDEGVKAGVPNHRHYLRIGDMESNLAPPSADVNRWFEKVSVLTPNGHSVGAIRPWQWPDAFMGLRREDAAAVRSAIAACDPPPRESNQSKEWAGYVIAETLGLGTEEKADKARLSSLLKEWVKSGVLAVEHVHDKRNGRPAPVIIAGPNNPMTETGA